MQVPCQVIAIVINCEGATEALVVKMPSNFEEILEDERDYIKNKVENLGCEYLTHFSQFSELTSLLEAVQTVFPKTKVCNI
jgi:hypothetical protein